MAEYRPEQVKQVIDELGITQVGKTSTVFYCYCPFHTNRDSHSFVVGKRTGLYYCFNQSCGARGNLQQLIERLSDRTQAEAMMLIAKYEKPVERGQLLSESLKEMFEDKPEYPHFPQAVVDGTVETFWNPETPEALEYMRGRRFSDDTLRFFELGYSIRKGNLVTYPVHTPDGKQVVGLVGRGVFEKTFRNSKNIPRSKVVFNLHNARRVSDRVIVTESGFDAMMIHQSGHKNVVATMGSSVSEKQVALLDRNFVEIIVFSDNDAAGEDMYKRIARMSGSTVLRPSYEDGTIYPEAGFGGKAPKDACDLTEDQIDKMIKRADNELWI